MTKKELIEKLEKSAAKNPVKLNEAFSLLRKSFNKGRNTMEDSSLVNWTGIGAGRRREAAKGELNEYLKKHLDLFSHPGFEEIAKDVDVNVRSLPNIESSNHTRILEALGRIREGKPNMNEFKENTDVIYVKSQLLADRLNALRMVNNADSRTREILLGILTNPNKEEGSLSAAKALHARATEKTLREKLPSNLSMPMVATVLGGTAIAGGLENFLENRDKQQGFLKMMNSDPEMNNIDKMQALTYYNTLYDLNPTMATQPTIAATFVRSHIEGGLGVPYQAASEIIKSRAEEMKAKANRSKNTGSKVRDQFSESIMNSFLGLNSK
jgi:hypothetical protein